MKKFQYSFLSSYTADGQIVEHSLLGSVADFVEEALKRGDMMVCTNMLFFLACIICTKGIFESLCAIVFLDLKK